MHSLLFVFALSLVLQPAPAHAMSQLGFRGGMNIGFRKADPEFEGDSRSKVGGIIGAVVQGALNDNNTVFIRGDVTYTERGWYDDAYFNDDVVETSLTFHEIAFGPTIVVRSQNKRFSPFAEAGIEAAAVVRKRAVAEYQVMQLESDVPQYSDNNISLNLGAGLILPAKNNEVQAVLRYSLGLKNVLDTDSDLTVKTTGIQLLIGYYFTLKR